MTGSPTARADIRRAVLDSVGTEPHTTTELRSHLDGDPDIIEDVLQRLSTEGTLQKKTGPEGTTIWWRATETAPARDRVQFEELVQTVSDYAIFLITPDGIVQTWNEGARQLKGYDADEIVGDHFSTFYSAEDREDRRPERNLATAARDGRVEDEGWRVHKDGSRFWARVTITAIRGDDGTLRGFTKVTRDLTERHEYERTIEWERERLELLNRTIRHDILNGLNVVNVETQTARTRLDADDPVNEHLDVIRDRVDDLTELIETMRELTAALETDGPHEREPMSLPETLREKIDLLEGSYSAVEVTTRGLDEVPDAVLADGLLSRVFENILTNAVVHNDTDQPRVAVTARETSFSPSTERPASPSDEGGGETSGGTTAGVTVHVADNGPGVPPDQRDAILEKGVSELDEPSNGFGLYLVREMVRSYEGRLDITGAGEAPDDVLVPDEQRGAVFSVTLPRA
ncbi:PAS domain S-box protein [Halosegnis longus]|uniref:histidine kinase n=1 Tax=Halosegnis longus TaxID=2216012 RepID=A0AAJ4R853_9EURY|nr:PAS domain-containing sensor histidine kinase [Salella cibi]